MQTERASTTAQQNQGAEAVRLAVDIGGTFTDIVLAVGDKNYIAKVLTTHGQPDDGFLEGAELVLAEAGLSPKDVGLIVHGTTLATNALIERKGAKVALVCTAGFRDSLEMAYEHRFEQYDVHMRRPQPLVPRWLRFTIDERIAADGTVLRELDEEQVRATVRRLAEEQIEAVAVGLLHSYAAPEHERRVREIIEEMLPGVPVSISSEVCPEIREYDRFSTTVANAYVQPLMQGYLTRLEQRLQATGYTCPLLMIMSSGTITTLGTASRFPIRLVESGPAGGAVLAANVAATCTRQQVLSFDMGGTTAKLCFIDGLQPQLSRSFEIAREYRNQKGSGIPVKIPVIEMVEIGAGGGSIGHVNQLEMIAVGPESAGSEPGPVCYGRGGQQPAVTDADLLLGRLDPDDFAGGKFKLDRNSAEAALMAEIGIPMKMDTLEAASGISEMVDENMSNAARIHGAESGKDLATRSMIAFGGAAPLHAARVAEKLGIKEIIVPTGAGVGSALGFLQAPIAYEIVRTMYMDLRQFDPDLINQLFGEMHTEAEQIVRLASKDEPLYARRTAYIRYRGQGHEIAVMLPEDVSRYEDGFLETLIELFEVEYRRQYGRVIPNLSHEVISWSLALGARQEFSGSTLNEPAQRNVPASSTRPIHEPQSGKTFNFAVHDRSALQAGDRLQGPAIICERETTTIVSSRYDAHINAHGYIVLTQKD